MKQVGLMAGVLAMLAIGCQTKEGTGTVAGAGAGGLAGAALTDSVAGTLIGAAVGGLVGREIGQALDERDEEQIVRSLETGQPVSWRDDREPYRYRVQPVESYDQYRGVRGPCRRFTMDVFVEGEGLVEETEGVACREDGGWRIVGS